MVHWLPRDGFAWRTLLLAAGFELGLGVAAWAAGRCIGVDVLETARPSVRGVFLGVGAAIPMLLGLAWLLLRPPAALRGLLDTVEEFTRTFLKPCGIIGLALISLSAGIGEEVLTRGLIQALALQHMPPPVALCVTGVLFGLMHPVSRAYVAIAALIGVHLGLAWVLSGPDLTVPVVAHALYDFIALLVLGRNQASAAPVQD